MGSSTIFGYEQENGKIYYIVSRELMLEEIEKYLILRKVPGNININKESDSIIDFFSKKKFEQEDSNWRILYMLDGTIKCRRLGSPGEFVYKNIIN